MKLNELIHQAAVKYGYPVVQGPGGIWHLRPGNTVPIVSVRLGDKAHNLVTRNSQCPGE